MSLSRLMLQVEQVSVMFQIEMCCRKYEPVRQGRHTGVLAYTARICQGQYHMSHAQWPSSLRCPDFAWSWLLRYIPDGVRLRPPIKEQGTFPVQLPRDPLGRHPHTADGLKIRAGKT